MKKTNSFVLFGRAFKNAKNDFWISVQVLLVATVVLAIIFYFVEHMAQPDEYRNPWDAFVWAITRYIGDPGHFAGNGPITLTGRYVDTLIGVLKILIFAVPAGLVANGFRKAMDDDKKLQRLQKASTALHKRYRRTGQSNSVYIGKNNLKYTYKLVPRYLSITDFQVKAGMSADSVIETVNYCPDFRLKNMSTILRRDEEKDRLVVEHFPLNTEYGCFLDRDSDVTIVSPTTSLGIGNSAFSLAAMGGFNYVSKELEPNPDEPFSFYVMSKSDLRLIDDYKSKEDVESQALHFMDDLKRLKKKSDERGRKHWFIFVLGTTKSIDCQVHFWRLATDRDHKMANRIEIGTRQYGSTVLTESEFNLQQIFNAVKGSLGEKTVTLKGEEQPIVTNLDNNNLLKGVTPSNIMCRVGGGVDCNSLTIRLGYEIAVFSTRHLLMLKDIADAFKQYIEPNREIPEDAKKCFLKTGDGFADDYGETKVFENDPVKLNKLLEKWKREALEKYEHLDLDGNEQDDYEEHHQQTKWKKIINVK